MDKDTRNAIERATQRARTLLEEDFAAQLEGDFDVHRDGEVAAKAGKHLSARQAFARERIVAAIEHKRAAGMSAADAARDYLRDAAFTTLNRFVALKMLEARELVQECITKGEQSGGYREFCGMALGLPLLPESAGYRLYIESLFDELSTEVKVLFDRRDPSSVLWPKRATFEQLLEILNATELARVWGEDETIGWVYQFFNGQDERRKMREESQAPRNSRELAVRNQFFTPRYVVQFLTDNTLGRIWYEMRGTKTALAGKCEYMVRKPGEEFAPRAKKDPRDLRVLDPTCGSGHFLLYAFDLLLAIYEEAWAEPEGPKSEATGKTLAEDYPSLDALKKAVPGLVLAHNLHGVDIDPRCAQIAQLALWMRAQKAYRDFGIGRGERPRIRRSNIVVAEPLVADEQIAKEFVAKLGDAELGRVFTSLVESLSLAGEMGLLLPVEELVRTPGKSQRALFAPPEESIRAALDRFVREDASATNTRRRLFVEDTEHGVALLGVAEKRFDVVLMNPPFGLATRRVFEHQRAAQPDCYVELHAQFVDRGVSLLTANGGLGVISSRSFLTISRLERYRKRVIAPAIDIIADLGAGVMDDAFVESAAYTLFPAARTEITGFDFRTIKSPADALKESVRSSSRIALGKLDRAELRMLPGQKILYNVPATIRALLTIPQVLEPAVATVRQGMGTFDDFRFLRLRWEVPAERVARNEWEPLAKGGAFAFYYSDIYLLINWMADGRELSAVNIAHNGQDAQVRQASDYWRRPGLTYSKRSQKGFSARVLPEGCIIAGKGPAILSLSEVPPLHLLGWVNSRLIRWLIELQANDHEYNTGILKNLPWVDNMPGRADHTETALLSDTERAVRALMNARASDETNSSFAGLECADSVLAYASARGNRERQAQELLNDVMERWDQLVDERYAVDSRSLTFGDEPEDPDGKGDDEQDGEEDESQGVATAAEAILFAGTGHAFGRWSWEIESGQSVDVAPAEVFGSIAGVGRRRTTPSEGSPAILVDDEGHVFDICAALRSSIQRFIREPDSAASACQLAAGHSDLRSWLRTTAFDRHVKRYSRSRRKAPIYWQLATPSASYSVWLYIHAFSKDMLFRVQNDYVAPKLAHEERRLESLTSEFRDGATAGQRKQLAAQEGLVEELRAFLDEVKRVAPLWKPNVDDGVIINFAPLWRLVPQNKSWQKELKSTWDALADGKYDWAHLAMHLWPERVVPKCAKDRSLAIAHELEDVFWVESTDGKWAARKTPTKGVDEIVKERTSPAVKSALKSLLEAPTAVGASKKARRGKTNA